MKRLTVDGVALPVTEYLGFRGAYYAAAVTLPDGTEAVAVRLPLSRAWRLWTEHDRLRVTMPGYERGAE